MRLVDYLLEKTEQKMTFVRIASGLSPKKAKLGAEFGKTSDKYPFAIARTGHSPPARKGIYAFIWPYIDHFLWSWKIDDQRSSYDWNYKRLFKKYGHDDKIPEWELDKIKNVNDKKAFDDYLRKHTMKFQYSGWLWTHLTDYTKNAKRRGTWVEVHTDELRTMIKKVFKKDLKVIRREFTKYPEENYINNPYNKATVSMDVSRLEVFIERVK